MLFDAFICHASEDKADFVRPLAQKLREEHVEVWYDEFSLRIGDSLRRSIDFGLNQSRFGIVVLSPNFFAKGWSQWELDGLVAREVECRGVILPIWHGVTREDVLAFSPPLADKVAATTFSGMGEVIRRLSEAIRPQGSTLVIARDHLIEMGFRPPVVTDDWWLDVAAASESNDMEGGFQEAMGWGRWGFPLPDPSQDPAERGYRLAWAAAQMEWQKAAESAPITQVSRPEEVHSFIAQSPGLAETCDVFIHYMLAYAPQLAIPGFGGQFEERIQQHYEDSLSEGRCPAEYILREPDLGKYIPSHIASHFFSGDTARFGPSVRHYEYLDCVAWLLSNQSTFLPENVRAVLTQGMASWAVWPWGRDELNPLERYFGYARGDFDGRLREALIEADSLSSLAISTEAREDAVHRLSFSAQLLSLPETGDKLADRLLSPEFLGPYFVTRKRESE